MAFRHYGGEPKPVSTAWTCPTCGTGNTGPLEGGCVACKAGADAKRSTLLRGSTILAPIQLPTDALLEAFEGWYGQQTPQALRGERDAALLGFIGGVHWARSLPEHAPAVPALLPIVTGGHLLAMVHSTSHEPTLLDSRTQRTILAALAFYRDNTLAYGAVPGELSAEETTQLIEQLTEPEPEKEPTV